MKHLFFLLIGLIFASSAHSQSITLKGKIEKRPWTKSIESYCAGGSDYYVLVNRRQSYVLEYNEALLEKWVGKKVILTGEKVQVLRKPAAEDNMSQHPVSPFGESGTNCDLVRTSSVKPR